MKYSIDLHNNTFKGWVVTNKEIYIRLSYNYDKTLVSELNRDRPDVVNLGLSNNLQCGFIFPNPTIDEVLYDGRFFLVDFIDKFTDEILISKPFFVGNKKKWQEKFEKFEILDRNDFDVQQISYSELFEQYPDIIAFKLLLIRLRRGKRAFGWRGSFLGHVYDSMQKDWQFFRELYIKYFDVLSEILTIRSLWSVVDTFVDFAEPLERSNALAISNMMYQERFAQTAHRVYDFIPLQDIKEKGQSLYWGNMKSNQLLADDAYDVFLTKNIEVLESTPILKKTFFKIFLESLKYEQSISGMNKKYSNYFSSAFKFYEDYMMHYLKSN